MVTTYIVQQQLWTEVLQYYNVSKSRSQILGGYLDFRHTTTPRIVAKHPSEWITSNRKTRSYFLPSLSWVDISNRGFRFSSDPILYRMMMQSVHLYHHIPSFLLASPPLMARSSRDNSKGLPDNCFNLPNALIWMNFLHQSRWFWISSLLYQKSCQVISMYLRLLFVHMF